MPGGEAITWRRPENGAPGAPAGEPPFFGETGATPKGEADPFAGLDLPEAAPRRAQEGVGTPALLAGKIATAASLPFDVGLTRRSRSRPPEPLAGRSTRARDRRPRHGDHLARSHAGRPRRRLPRPRARTRGLCPAPAPQRFRPVRRRPHGGPDADGRRARRPEAGPGGPDRPQDRPEHEVRLAGAEAPRHHGRPLRRRDADLLRARRRRGSHGMDELSAAISATRRSASTSSPARAAPDHLRPGRDRPRHRLCGRGRRRDAPAMAGAEAAARRRTPGDGLRDPGAAHGRRAGPHGGTASWSTDKSSPVSPAISRRSWPGSRTRSRRSRARRSPSARRSRSATSSSARWGCRARRRRRRASGRRPRRSSTSLPRPATNCRGRSWNGASSRS